MGRRAASNLPRASRPPPRPLYLCMHVAIACARVRGRLRASAILTPFVGTAHFSRARCRTVATPLPRTRCSVEAVGAYPMPTLCLPYAYPTPTLRLPYALYPAYPMPTLCLQAGGAPLLQHDAQRAAHQHGHVDCDALPRPRRSARARGVPRHPEGTLHAIAHATLHACHSACHSALHPT